MRSFARRTLGLAYRRLLPADARNSLRLALALEDRDRAPRAIKRFDEARVLVLAPHMDDEVAGVGGTLSRHVAAGAEVTVVFTTDGHRGCEHLAGPGDGGSAEARWERCRRTRKAESREACALLGVTDLVFLDGPDGSLRPTDALVSALSEVLSRRRPELIYHPSLLDLHDDHWQTNRLLALSLRALGIDGVALRGYEVWTPLIANALCDISDVMPAKRDAFRRFTSQNSAVNYPRAFEGLAAYRSIHAGSGKGFVEAFHETRVPVFERLIAWNDRP